MDAKLDNFIANKHKEIVTEVDDASSYAPLYSEFQNNLLSEMFSVLHGNLIACFRRMNQRLPTKENGNYYWASESRMLIFAIDQSIDLYKTLKGTELEFEIDEGYHKLFEHCKTFLAQYRGSTIPPNMEKIEIYETIPIFISKDVVSITRTADTFPFNLQLIGEGSYAKVFKYTDNFYNQQFVLKRAKNDLTDKELIRFKQEFEEMNNFSSPYIVSVYNYNDTKKEYIMEFMDSTLFNYIQSKSTSLTKDERKSLIFQILKAFEYIHSENRLHRDISPTNILIKKYNHVDVVKISDFGLVKTPSSELTSTNTDFKGWFNDPTLKTEGFNNYEFLHEIYALTLIVYFVLTGKTSITNIRNPQTKAFVDKGTNADKTTRFQSINEIREAIHKLQ